MWSKRGIEYQNSFERRRAMIDNEKAIFLAGLKIDSEDEQVAYLDEIDVADEQSPEALVLIDDALSRLSQQDFEAAELVKLRYFTGFSIDEIAQMTGTSRTVAYGQWEYAKAWLRCDLGGDSSSNF